MTGRIRLRSPFGGASSGLSASIQAQDVRPGATSPRQNGLQKAGQKLAQKKRAGLNDPAANFWIYDDVEAGYATAKKSGKPMLVSFRCVP